MIRLVLDLRRVRVFAMVAELRSFSAAAEALDYTQPAVSHHVGALERELGQRLINRGTRPLTLTDAGETLLAAASVALAEFERAERDLEALASGATGRVAVGSVVSGLRTVVPRGAREFRRRFPAVELRLSEGQPTDLLTRVRSGDLDVAVIVVPHGAQEPDPGVFSSHVLLEQPIVVGLPAAHRLAGRKRIRLEQLRNEEWLLPSRDRFPELRQELDALLADAGVEPRVVLEITDDLAGAQLLIAGLGIGLLPGALALPIDGIAVVPLDPPATRRLFAVTIDGRLSAPVETLLEELRAAA